MSRFTAEELEFIMHAVDMRVHGIIEILQDKHLKPDLVERERFLRLIHVGNDLHIRLRANRVADEKRVR